MEDYLFTLDQKDLRDWEIEHEHRLSLLELFILNDLVMSYGTSSVQELKLDGDSIATEYIQYNAENIVNRYPVLPCTRSEIINCYLGLVKLGLIIERKIRNENSFTGFDIVCRISNHIIHQGPLYPKDYLDYEYEQTKEEINN